VDAIDGSTRQDAAVPTVDVNGIRLHYERRGSGPPLLFLNGSGATLATTGFLLNPFAERCEVVGHDQRGLGLTTVPPGPYSMGDYAADALGLLDHLGWEQAAVVGISFGGMVAQEVAVTAPDRVRRLALACTSPGGAGGSSYPLHELADLGSDERADIGTRILDTRFTPEWLAEHPNDRALAEMAGARRDDAGKSDDQRRGETEQLQARRHHDVWDRLHRVACPTLVAAGRYDGIAPLANSEAIASRIPSAELRVYEGGHAFFAQDGAALPDLVDFLASD
jgi:pimeloyl-ACP methyl ester carboxylesterase